MLYENIKKLVEYGIQTGLTPECERIYTTNLLLELFQEDSYEDVEINRSSIELEAVLEGLLDEAVKRGIIEDSIGFRDLFDTKIMNCLVPRPAQIQMTFAEKYEESPETATEYFYKLSQDSNYIRRYRVKKDMKWKVDSPYGEIDITINLSKPEKDPKAIAAARNAKNTAYPKCQLCMENEGYLGRINHPARSNHRVIRFQMEDKEWGFQYSPYAYFNEHSIFFYGQHEPMKISDLTFERLLSIVEEFPGYFAGSNADLPIVGGSILTHEHYQGGRHTFPMEIAEVEETFSFEGFPEVEAGIVNWPMSVIRIKSREKESLLALSSKILAAWRTYSDPEVGVLAESDGTPHHTITPIARKRDGQYELDLVLRDNQTSEEHPDGVYHPHADVQHIKKENIGLIEVMGLAILPPRLKSELKEVEDFLLDKCEAVAPIHQEWAEQLKENHPEVTAATAEALVRQSVADIFARVLEDAGVYKTDNAGRQAFKRFLNEVGLVD